MSLSLPVQTDHRFRRKPITESGNAWYRDLKPDYRPGDVFDLFAS